MSPGQHRIPESDIRLAARLALEAFGANAQAAIGAAISAMDREGKGELVHAWRDVAVAMEALNAAAPESPRTVH